MNKIPKISKHLIVASILLVVLSSAVAAEDPGRFIVNSEDWTDVYSVMQFAALSGLPSHFLASTRHATILSDSLPRLEHIWVVSSDTNSFISGYEALLTSKGYSTEEFTYDDVNLALAQQLEGVSNFVVISPSYGYNAVSVAPYAAASNSYVLFADDDNVDDITTYLSGLDQVDVIIYGHVDREVTAGLEQFSPEIINNGGDRFLNNIEMVKRHREIRGGKQVILTNGEFIEQEIMKGNEPVVFIGTNNVPDSVRSYIQESDIEVGVLIGNELVGTATFIRRQIGISVFVKFAQGARQPEGSISQVEALDMYYLPSYTLNLEFDSVRYNRATKQLEVTLRNTEDQALYLLGTYTLEDQDGNSVTVGDSTPNFMDGNEVRTFVYDDIELAEGEIGAEAFVIYGESTGALERELRLSIPVESVTILDACEISLSSVFVNTRKKVFSVGVENIGDVTCYVDADIIDLIVAGAKNNYGAEEIVQIKPGATGEIDIKVADFEVEDLEDNEEVRVKAYYGERKNSLIRTTEGKFLLEVRKGDYVFYTLIVIIIILLILIYRRKKKREEEEHQKRVNRERNKIAATSGAAHHSHGHSTAHAAHGHHASSPTHHGHHASHHVSHHRHPGHK